MDKRSLENLIKDKCTSQHSCLGASSIVSSSFIISNYKNFKTIL